MLHNAAHLCCSRAPRLFHVTRVLCLSYPKYTALIDSFSCYFILAAFKHETIHPEISCYNLETSLRFHLRWFKAGLEPHGEPDKGPGVEDQDLTQTQPSGYLADFNLYNRQVHHLTGAVLT